ncbi:hypothetical protein T484DRAFT_1892025, partial [Baffinella frigidus]
PLHPPSPSEAAPENAGAGVGAANKGAGVGSCGAAPPNPLDASPPFHPPCAAPPWPRGPLRRVESCGGGADAAAAGAAGGRIVCSDGAAGGRIACSAGGRIACSRPPGSAPGGACWGAPRAGRRPGGGPGRSNPPPSGTAGLDSARGAVLLALALETGANAARSVPALGWVPALACPALIPDDAPPTGSRERAALGLRFSGAAGAAA